eukprot:762060-Hanusia_phi.AAC.1
MVDPGIELSKRRGVEMSRRQGGQESSMLSRLLDVSNNPREVSIVAITFVSSLDLQISLYSEDGKGSYARDSSSAGLSIDFLRSPTPPPLVHSPPLPPSATKLAAPPPPPSRLQPRETQGEVEIKQGNAKSGNVKSPPQRPQMTIEKSTGSLSKPHPLLSFTRSFPYVSLLPLRHILLCSLPILFLSPSWNLLFLCLTDVSCFQNSQSKPAPPTHSKLLSRLSADLQLLSEEGEFLPLPSYSPRDKPRERSEDEEESDEDDDDDDDDDDEKQEEQSSPDRSQVVPGSSKQSRQTIANGIELIKVLEAASGHAGNLSLFLSSKISIPGNPLVLPSPMKLFSDGQAVLFGSLILDGVQGAREGSGETEDAAGELAGIVIKAEQGEALRVRGGKWIIIGCILEGGRGSAAIEVEAGACCEVKHCDVRGDVKAIRFRSGGRGRVKSCMLSCRRDSDCVEVERKERKEGGKGGKEEEEEVRLEDNSSLRLADPVGLSEHSLNPARARPVMNERSPPVVEEAMRREVTKSSKMLQDAETERENLEKEKQEGLLERKQERNEAKSGETMNDRQEEKEREQAVMDEYQIKLQIHEKAIQSFNLDLSDELRLREISREDRKSDEEDEILEVLVRFN